MARDFNSTLTSVHSTDIVQPYEAAALKGRIGTKLTQGKARRRKMPEARVAEQFADLRQQHEVAAYGFF
jgi:hypothetical protein